MRLQTTREIVRFVSFPTRDPGDSFLDEYDDDVGIDPLVPLATSVGDVRDVLSRAARIRFRFVSFVRRMCLQRLMLCRRLSGFITYHMSDNVIFYYLYSIENVLIVLEFIDYIKLELGFGS